MATRSKLRTLLLVGLAACPHPPFVEIAASPATERRAPPSHEASALVRSESLTVHPSAMRNRSQRAGASLARTGKLLAILTSPLVLPRPVYHATAIALALRATASPVRAAFGPRGPPRSL
jgi:hypothetical protein